MPPLWRVYRARATWFATGEMRSLDSVRAKYRPPRTGALQTTRKGHLQQGFPDRKDAASVSHTLFARSPVFALGADRPLDSVPRKTDFSHYGLDVNSLLMEFENKRSRRPRLRFYHLDANNNSSIKVLQVSDEFTYPSLFINGHVEHVPLASRLIGRRGI